MKSQIYPQVRIYRFFCLDRCFIEDTTTDDDMLSQV